MTEEPIVFTKKISTKNGKFSLTFPDEISKWMELSLSSEISITPKQHLYGKNLILKVNNPHGLIPIEHECVFDDIGKCECGKHEDE